MCPLLTMSLCYTDLGPGSEHAVGSKMDCMLSGLLAIRDTGCHWPTVEKTEHLEQNKACLFVFASCGLLVH